MEVSVITHPTFGNISEVREAARLVNQQQTAFSLSIIEADWIPEISLGNKSIDPNQVSKEKKKELGNKPSILITQRPLKGGFFSEYKPNFYLISTSAWEAVFPNRPLHLYIAYLIACILSYFPLKLSERESNLQTERHENETIGCINDYCNVFEDIWQSMLKAQICLECENDLIRLGAQHDYLDSVKQILVLVKDIAASLMKVPLKVFVSYKWEDDAHNIWVEKVATDLRVAGIDAKLDKWEVRFGDSFTDYMTSKIAEADVVLFIMTSRSVAAAEAPIGEGGAVKFEMQMATHRRTVGEKMRLIGIYREGNQTAAHLRDHKYADFRDDSKYQARLQELIDDLFGKEKRPSLGGSVDSNILQRNSQRIVSLLNQEKRAFSTEEIAERLGINKITVLESMRSLLDDGIVEKADTKAGGGWQRTLAETGKTTPRLDGGQGVVDKWVNLEYVEKSGIAKELQNQGYDVGWSAANNESERVDLEGWEPVLINQSDGTYARLKIHDHSAVGGYLIFLKRQKS